MKYKPYFILSFILLFCATACDDFHNNIQPQDNLPIDAVYQSAADLETALAGVYDVLQQTGLADLNLLLIPELLSCNGDLDQSGLPERTDLSNHTMRSSNFVAEQTWVAAYEAINLCNAILSTMPVIKDAALTPDLKNRIEGEALLIRGFLHLELLWYYGKLYGDDSPDGGVPISTEAVFQKEDLTFPPRASVQATYDRATEDLSNAKNLLAAIPFRVDKANALAAEALLAKIAFQQGNYQEAGAIGQSLIDQIGFDPTSPPQDIFNETSDHLIWVVAFTPGDNSRGKFWFHENNNRVKLSANLKADFEAIATPAQQLALEEAGLQVVDLRVDPGILTSQPLISSDTQYINKYEDIVSFADDTPIARLSEFVLMRAEALARAGDLEGGIQQLNLIRERALRVIDADNNELPDQKQLLYFTTDDFQNAEELIAAIALERRVELCFEGNYLLDAIRLEQDIKDIPYDDCRLRMPIPQRERDVNPNLTDDCY